MQTKSDGAYTSLTDKIKNHTILTSLALNVAYS